MKGDKSIEERGFRIVNPGQRHYKHPRINVTGPVKSLLSKTEKIKVRYLARREELLITSTCSRGDGQFPHEHEVFQIPLGKLLKELGIGIPIIKDALEKQRIQDQVKGASTDEDEEPEKVVVH